MINNINKHNSFIEIEYQKFIKKHIIIFGTQIDFYLPLKLINKNTKKIYKLFNFIKVIARVVVII